MSSSKWWQEGTMCTKNKLFLPDTHIRRQTLPYHTIQTILIV